jgi:hypothetical protein
MPLIRIEVPMLVVTAALVAPGAGCGMAKRFGGFPSGAVRLSTERCRFPDHQFAGEVFLGTMLQRASHIVSMGVEQTGIPWPAAPFVRPERRCA